MAPHLQRALILDPSPDGARLLGELMRQAVPECQVWAAPDMAKALKLAGSVNPDVCFAELDASDGLAFTRELRRSDFASRRAPVILTASRPTPDAILAGRDAGAHELLKRPFTFKDLLRRLEAVTLHPRDWIEAVEYIGPDRRRFNTGDAPGPFRRPSDPPEPADGARVLQALKIMRSVVSAVEKDAAQALRALQAQTRDIYEGAGGLGDARLRSAAIEFGRYLEEAERSGGFNTAELERKAAPLLAFLPKGGAGTAAAA